MTEDWLTYLAIASSICFLVLLVLMLVGTLGDFDTPEDINDNFQLFSFQSIVAFCMSFGWSGVAFKYQMLLPPIITYPLAILFGLVVMVLFSAALRSLKKLNSKAVSINYPQVGDLVEVYNRIAAKNQSYGFVKHEGEYIKAETKGEETLNVSDIVEVVEVLESVGMVIVRARTTGGHND